MYKTKLRALVNSFEVSIPFTRGFFRYQEWPSNNEAEALSSPPYAEFPADFSNPLQTYFDSHTEGRGIWKWKHYFEIYHRHFSKFIGREVRILEIGVYSGGSLEMWKQYFGPKCRVYGVDIEEACKAYTDDQVEIFIGDQADHNFWAHFKKEVSLLDIIIDDGGHHFHQQRATLEEMLPHLRAGGVYLCEDAHDVRNQFAAYIAGLSLNLHAAHAASPSEHLAVVPTQFQKSIHSVHLYPFVAVIERTESPATEFVAPKHGTEWQPFL